MVNEPDVQNDSLCEVLRAVQPELGDTLVGAPARAALAELATRVGLFQGSGYLECRLGAPEAPQVDLLASIRRFEREALAGELSRMTGSAPGLDALARLLRAWCSPASLLYAHVPVAWVEFDDVVRQADSPRGPEANVCVALMPSYVDPFSPRLVQGAAQVARVALEAAEVVRAATPTLYERAQLERCIEAMPAGGHWIHLSIMSKRQPSVLKLYGVLPAASLLGLLAAMEWRGDLARVEEVVRRYYASGPAADSLYVDLLVPTEATDERPYVGICFSQQQLGVAGEADPARALLDRLLVAQLCTPAEADQLRRWPTPAAQGEHTGVDRWFDLKLVLRDGQPLLAKAYLGFSPKRSLVGLGLSASRIRAAAPYPRPPADPRTS